MDQLINHLDTIYFLMLCTFVGIEVIGNVPAILHTPLMSGANAISGVITIGALLFLHEVDNNNYLALALSGLALILGTLNLVGGFVVTHKMLQMFNSKSSKA